MTNLSPSRPKSIVAILTNFQEFNPGYSLTGIVLDQIHMLVKHNHKVILFVNQQFKHSSDDETGLNKLIMDYPHLIVIEKRTRFAHLYDYQTDDLSDEHSAIAWKCGMEYGERFMYHDVDVAFTHDFVFTGWNLVYFHAIIQANKFLSANKENVKWYHWIHSVPNPHYRKPWWDLQHLGTNHYLVYPNQSEIRMVSESWHCRTDHIKIIPHIKDIRTWFDFGSEALSFIDRCPDIMRAKVIQVYPCSSDRLSAKQLDIVIQLFGEFKHTSKVPVFLVIANQWATGTQPKENISEFETIASKAGLIEGIDFAFTSKLAPEWENGISKRMLRELQLLSNLFIFPTMSESFGLVGPEAALSGAMPVTNRSLSMMSEILSNVPPSFEFGSYQRELITSDKGRYLRSVALTILSELQLNSAIMAKSFCRIRYNMDNLYYTSYLQIIE